MKKFNFDKIIQPTSPVIFYIFTYTIILLLCILLIGCSGKDSDASDKNQSDPLRDSTPKVLTPSADGTVLYGDNVSSVDASNISQGYVMVSYSGDCEKVKVMITGPDQNDYTYLLKDRGKYDTYPLTSGNGSYTVQIFENVADDLYAVALTQTIDVQLDNEFLPFLYPNQYVNFTEDSEVVKKGSSLASNAHSDLDVVENVYHYVINNITYDEDKAENIDYGYLPLPDDTLASGSGICSDYAALMASMLRSQGIPTRLDVGYSGTAYHAWISTYVDDIGWVDDIIEFDGKSWELMDPTLAANNTRSAVKKYIGEGNNYVLKYSY